MKVDTKEIVENLDISQAKKILESLGIPFKEEDGALVIGSKNDNNAHLDLLEFLKIYVKDDNDIQSTENGFIVTVKTIGAYNLAMMLVSLFSDTYDIAVKNQETIEITVKGDAQNLKTESTEISARDFRELAERLDNDFVEITIFEDKLEITSERQKTLEAIAKLADSIDESLEIILDRKKVIIK